MSDNEESTKHPDAGKRPHVEVLPTGQKKFNLRAKANFSLGARTGRGRPAPAQTPPPTKANLQG